jgi:hypothetical protein
MEDSFIRLPPGTSYESMFKGVARILCNKSPDENLDNWSAYHSDPTTQKLYSGRSMVIPVRHSFTWWYKPVNSEVGAQYKFFSRVKADDEGSDMIIWYFSCNVENSGSDEDTDKDVDEHLNTRLTLTTGVLEMLHKRITQLERRALIN